MTKSEKIDYLNSIKDYLNLSAICKLYNEKSDDYIDYNNLRIVLNKTSETRLSEKKLDSFINFLFSYLFKEVFKTSVIVDVNEQKLKLIVETHSQSLTQNILQELKDGFRS